MEVTVKTLDSQTKTIQVAAETTVKDFKKKIAEELGIPTEKQRLIFQGKVLQDEKPLQEYRVDGCVVHLVEKQPPRTTRSNGQSTETTTSSTPSTTSPGNAFMGAFALPVDVMGVTQQIVQGIIEQIGAESAQANISTSSSDDGSSVNVHINLSTVMSRNDARSRIGPARVHLNNVSSIVSRLQNDGMLPNNDMDEEASSSSNSQSQNEMENNNESSPEDLADILQEVVRLNDEMRPHLERYQELLRASSRQLRPGDDSLPDLTAEALHSLSHAYHALSDLTTNFRVPEPRLNVLPPMSPIPASIGHAHAHMRPGPATGQSQPPGARPDPTTAGQTSRTTTGSTVTGGILTGSGLFTGSGILTGSGVINTNGSFTGTTPTTSGPNCTARSETPGDRPRPRNPNPFLGFPVNLRNMPNLAVQFNPGAGNITIAHIMTTAVDEHGLRATTTTTNSTPAPRTSSRGSAPVPPSQGNGQTPQGTEAMDDSTSQQPAPPTTTPGTTTPGVTPSVHSHGNGSGQSGPRSNENNTVLNFPPQHVGHRDPLLPCQSFHFASLIQRPTMATSQASSVSQNTPPVPTPGQQQQQQQQPPNGQQTEQEREKENGQTPQPPNQPQQQPQPSRQPQSSPQYPIPIFHTAEVPSPAVIQQLLNIGQRAAAEAAVNMVTGQDANEFLEFFLPPQSTVPQSMRPPRDRSNDMMFDFASRIAERQRTMPAEGRTASRGSTPRSSEEGIDTLSRFIYRLSETFPMQQMMLTVLGGTVEPYSLTRSMTKDFLKNDVLRGAEATPENLQRATEGILEELQKNFEVAFAQCNVKDGIDAPATLLTYLRPKIRRLLEIINSTESDSTYAAEMTHLLSRTSVELIALTEYCLEDGIAGMEKALRTSLGNSLAISELEPGLRELAVDTTWTCVRDLRNSLRLRESALLPFVVRKEKRKKSKESPKPQRKESKKDENTSRNSAREGASGAGNTSATSRTNKTSTKPEEVAMETDEEWKKVIPAEWVPVISQDIIRQRRLPRQAPFSDAYINGMPSKRRKIMEAAEPAPYNQCVSATLKRSIAKAGVTPKTDLEKVNKEANNSPSLEQGFEQEVKNEVRERLSRDTDYNSEKFPSIHNYFEKDSKR